MNVDLHCDLEDGTTITYQGEEFEVIPRPSDAILIEDEENDIELTGTVTDILWIKELVGGWLPSISIQINHIAGEGAESFLNKS